MTTVILIAAAAGLLLWSWRRDKRKTRESALIAKTQLLSIGPKIAAILALIGLVLAVIPPQYIQSLLGGANTLLS
ncbi:MAG: permease, partial [Chloroflexota bacterium]